MRSRAVPDGDAASSRPISDYALLGDTRTAALVSSEGSIDWMCLPRFDSDPVFGKLVDPEFGGSFLLGVEAGHLLSRRYRRSSAILETEWKTETGVARLTEGMVLELSGRLLPQMLLVRRLSCLAGSVSARLLYDPRPGLPGTLPRCERRHGALFATWRGLALALSIAPDQALEPGKMLTLDLGEGRDVTTCLTLADRHPAVISDPGDAFRMLEECDKWWRGWCRGIQLETSYRDPLERSLITIRLLTYSPSGAPVAAPTLSLPETLGGSRNWDYRFSWPRDASVGTAAFLAGGKHEEAESFLRWLVTASRLSRPRLDVLYTVFGRKVPEQKEVPVSGYAGSRPVNIGNDARDQEQLDVYGWVVDSVWSLVQAGHRLNGEEYRAIRGFADYVASHWRNPDSGLWEIPGPPRYYVHSKLWSWLALDRAARIARSLGRDGQRAQRWELERDRLASELRKSGFDGARNTYVQAYDLPHLDSSLLLLPLTGFEDPSSPRVIGTIEAIRAELSAGGPLMYRYSPRADDLDGREGAFLPCSFWLVEALIKVGRRDEGIQVFEDILRMVGDLCLLPEEIDPSTHAFLGNYPIALSQAGVVHAIVEIENALRA